MFLNVVIAYSAIAFVVFVLLVIFGKVLKKISLGNGMTMGLLNSLLLSALWPITMMCSIVGLVCECIKTLKRL